MFIFKVPIDTSSTSTTIDGTYYLYYTLLVRHVFTQNVCTSTLTYLYLVLVLVQIGLGNLAHTPTTHTP